MASEHIEQKLKVLPKEPGVYLMKDEAGEILYIGKAKVLRNRVRSYFKSSHTGKTARLVREIRDFETIITSSDKEALLLEVSLIQKHKPPYNILLKFGTTYPYLKITNEEDPQLVIASEYEDDGGQYFGPYPNVGAAMQVQQILHKTYPLRRCPKRQNRACLYYHMDQCIGPCVREVSEAEYRAQIAKIRSFLNGNVSEIKQDLQERMQAASDEMNYEAAEEFRDQISYIEQTVEKQAIISGDFTPRDFFNFYMDKGWISIQVFFVRQATLIKRDVAMFPCHSEPQEELLSYIVQYYQDKQNRVPKEIYVPPLVDTELLAETLPGHPKVNIPQRGAKKEMLEMAYKNAKLSLLDKFRLIAMKQQKTTGAIEELSEALGLGYLEVIEAFDHSNIQGTNPVSAMVSFKDGKANKSGYRKYKIKTVDGADEAATTREVIRRRYSRLLKEEKALPDLVLMDGGKVQVGAAREVLVHELGLDLPVAGMVKDEKHQTAGLIFGPGLEVVDLSPRSQAFHLVQRIQDEVHRFAISFHRNVRSKNSFTSELDDIKGVGQKTRTKVLRHFKSMRRLKEASVDDIRQLGIPEQVAHRIKETLNDYN